MIKVSVPATSANIGMGYDILGLAINIHAHFYFQKSKYKLEIDGCATSFQNQDNLVYKGFTECCRKYNLDVPYLHITIDSHIPESRGLGSSAACIVGGIIGANQWFKLNLSKKRDTKFGD